MKTVIIYILLLMALQANLFSAGFINSGAKISTTGVTYINVNTELKNENNGTITIKDGSHLKVGTTTVSPNHFTNSAGGTVKLLSNSIITVFGNLINDGTFYNGEGSNVPNTTIVKKNVINSGTINNIESIIEIGE